MWLWLVVHRNCIIPFSNFCDVDIFPVIMQLSSNSFWCIEIKIKIDDTLFKGRVQKKRKKSSGIFHKGGKASFKKMKSICGRKLEGGGSPRGKKKFLCISGWFRPCLKINKKSMETDPKSGGEILVVPKEQIPEGFGHR